jgi:FlaA1/EpsC-like NDP-sugar epimerase
MKIRSLIGRDRDLFVADASAHAAEIAAAMSRTRVLVIGGAGSIGREVVAQLFKLPLATLDVIDISENSLVELVRALRSASREGPAATQFLPLDIGGLEANAFLASQPRYDFVLNFSAMKHVRSEKDEFSLMRMIKINILDTLASLERAATAGTAKYFAVSTDKAQNPANLMGATKRIMEDVIFARSASTCVSTARFANVAFSDGSLLHGFRQRLQLQQPISAPSDVRRYFVSGEEAGRLCLASIALGANREIFFPRLDANADLLSFADIAVRFLEANGYAPEPVASEDEARDRAAELIAQRRWPCYFFASNTSGEKPFEEFHGPSDTVDWDRFVDISVIAREAPDAAVRARVETFLDSIAALRAGRWSKPDLVALLTAACPELAHVETGRNLDSRM